MEKTKYTKRIAVALTVLLSLVLIFFAAGCNDSGGGEGGGNGGGEEQRLTAAAALSEGRKKAGEIESFTLSGNITVGPMNGTPALQKAFSVKSGGGALHIIIEGVYELYSDGTGTYEKDYSAENPAFIKISDSAAPKPSLDELFVFMGEGLLTKTDGEDKSYGLNSFYDYKLYIGALITQMNGIKDATVYSLFETVLFGSGHSVEEFLSGLETFAEKNPDTDVAAVLAYAESAGFDVKGMFAQYGLDYDSFIADYGNKKIAEVLGAENALAAAKAIGVYVRNAENTVAKALKDLRITDLDILTTKTVFDKAEINAGLTLTAAFDLYALNLTAKFAVEDFPLLDKKTGTFMPVTIGMDVKVKAGFSSLNSTAVTKPEGIA